MSKLGNKFRFVCVLCCNLMLIKFLIGDFFALGVAAISEQKRQEIARIRSELTAALDNSNENVAGDNVIVQPEWTKTADKSVPTESAKVQINAHNLQEAAAIRAKIADAVARDKYATVDATQTQDIKRLEGLLAAKAKANEALLTTVAAPLEEERVSGGSTDDHQNSNWKAPNIINANIGDDSEIDVRKLQRLELSKRRTREYLLLKYVEEDFSFAFGFEVNEWKHIVHAGEEYFIGRRVTDLLIIRKDMEAKYQEGIAIDVGDFITWIETYTYWNLEQQQHEAVILIATGDKVLWYRANAETKEIELYWHWMVGSTILSLTHFSLDSKDYLIIASNQSFLAGHHALNIYQFKLESKEFWIAQRLQLQHAFVEVTFLNSGRDVILAVPQNNTAAIYTFNSHESGLSYIHFKLQRLVPAEGILTIAGFKMGGRSYLALTGRAPQILMYQEGDFVSKTLLGTNFGLVELFLPIPVRTYRDDLILLVQHKVDFSTHTVTVVETLLWDGEAFETSVPVPCHLGKHVVYGVGCMLDWQREEGIKGAAILRNGSEISIIVPRYKAESGLFHLHTELLAKNSELLDLQEIFDFLKGWVKEQDDLIAQAVRFLQIPDEEFVKSQSDVKVFESLKTPEFAFNGEVAEIYVNDYKWTSEDSKLNLEWLIESVEDLDGLVNKGVRKKRNVDAVSYDELDFDEVLVNNLELENLNGQQFYIQNGELSFEGLVHFADLEVLAKAIDLGKREVSDEDYFVEGDLEFDQINEVEWSDIKRNLVFKSQTESLQFEQLEVTEDVLADTLLTVNTLNNLNFPDDYLLSKSSSASIIRSEKHFVNSLSVGSITTNGSINGKNPADVITLKDAQEWRGTPIFKHLEVSKIFELHGQIHARDKDMIPANPTLEEMNVIASTCYFNELTVLGPIIVKERTDDQALGTRLRDVILRSADPQAEILVPSFKSFNTITFPFDFYLQNNTINQIPVDDFVTINTEQTLNISALEAYVYFHNLSLNGSYDGVKIEDLLEEVVLLENAVDLSTAELIFPGELRANSVSILDTVNKQPIKDNLQTVEEDLHLKSAEFEHLQAPLADFSQDVLGQGKLNNVQLHTPITDSSAEEPDIWGNIFLEELILEQGLQTDELNGIQAELVLDFLSQKAELAEMVSNGLIEIDHLTVTGNVKLHKVNGLLFDEDIQLNALELNRPNFLSTNLRFKNRLTLNGHLNVMGNFRGNHFPDIMNDIVVRSTNSCIDIKAHKSFINPVQVLQNTQVKTLNGVPMENIAWLSKENNFKGSVHLKGNLRVGNMDLQGHINNFDWQDLENLLYFDENLKSYVLKNTVEFKNALFLHDLTVKGDLQDVQNVPDFFGNLIYKNQLCRLSGTKTFTGRVTIANGAYITNLNGQHLPHLFSNMVFINDPHPVVIEGSVTFEESVQANGIFVDKKLSVESLNGCSLREWVTDSLRVDRDQHIPHALEFVAGSIDWNPLSVRYINDKDLSRIFTLNTAQSFNETVRLSSVLLDGFISCKGRVNNKHLEQEFKNTVMTEGDQHIFTPLTIKSIVVLGDLFIQGPVNGNKDLKDVATLHEDLVLESPVYFQSLYSPRVIMNDLVTGIDFNEWFESAVKHRHPDIQYITGNWSTNYLKIGKACKDLQYTLKSVETGMQYIDKSEPTSCNQDVQICQLIREIWQDLTKKSVLIKYIEESNVELPKEFKTHNKTVHKFFTLKTKGEHFLLINAECKSHIFKWASNENKFIFENSFDSGPVHQIEVVPVFNNSIRLEFINNFSGGEKTNCSSQGVKKWQLAVDSTVLHDAVPVTSFLFYKTQGNTTSLWSLHNETVEQLDTDYSSKEKWQLPVARNATPYRVVPFATDAEVLLTNGEHLVLLRHHLDKTLTKSYFNNQEQPLLKSSHMAALHHSDSESLLKPNSSLTRSVLFTDFEQAVERILVNLNQRLNQQIYVIQLSIPETDLLNDQLVLDFLGVMNKLQRQTIYSSEFFHINFKDIELPKNPAQVLAAYVVQMCWPAVVEIEVIQSFLTTNTTRDRTLYSSVKESLGLLIKDVVVLANERNGVDHTLKLTHIIERIRDFENQTSKFLKSMQDMPSEIRNWELAAAKPQLRVMPQSQDNILVVESFHLPGHQQGEILSLQVGSITNSRHLWAVTNASSFSTPPNIPGIYLYTQRLTPQLYQIIPSMQPRSLQQIRIKQETFLLYIQDCCQVQILRYSGSLGFVPFARISSEQYVIQILTTTLPSERGNLKHLIALLLENNIQFYEFVTAGLDVAPPALLLNCL